jgi:MoaA/NifB/PqqE/SkfB family radical SAM enzyme
MGLPFSAKKTARAAAAAAGFIMARATGGSSWVGVTYLVTMRCNASCPYCDFPRTGFDAELSTTEAVRLVRSLRGTGTLRLGLSGGEPLLRDDIGEIASAAAGCGFITSMVTNGILLRERLDDLRPVDYILCTIDGGRSVHDGIRGPGSFDAALEGMRTLKRFGRARLGLVTAVHRGNLGELEEPLKIAKELGARVFYQPVQRRDGWMGGKFDGMLKGDEQQALFHRLLEWKRQGKPVGNSKRYLEITASGGESFPKCVSGRFLATVLPDGRVAPCCMVPFQHSVVRLDPSNPGRALADLRVPACGGCTISPYMENNLVINLDAGALLSALEWRQWTTRL